MKKTFLLDTHILLWWAADNRNLSTKIKNLIKDQDNSIFVSVATMWEIAVKKSLKKLEADDSLKFIIEKNNISFLSITIDHAIQIEHLPLIHKDPFDRILVAQCMVEKITLITHDSILHRYNISCFK